jgi:hypothetical protein
MHRLSASFVLGYHGCSASVAEQLFSGNATFKASDNDYDWLGPGIYFWEANPRRALRFAEEKRARDGASWETAVVGAAIDLGLCLDLSTEVGLLALRTSYDVLAATMLVAGAALPVNKGGSDQLLRHLDCAVVRHLHAIREEAQQPPVDTVRGVFTEGPPLYEGSGFPAKTHVQICACNPRVIRGIFRVPREDLEVL